MAVATKTSIQNRTTPPTIHTLTPVRGRLGILPGTGSPDFANLIKYFWTRLATWKKKFVYLCVLKESHKKSCMFCDFIQNIWPEFIEAWWALTSINYHRNVYVSILLNQGLAQTMLRAKHLNLVDAEETTINQLIKISERQTWKQTCFNVLFPKALAIFSHRLDSTSSCG